MAEIDVAQQEEYAPRDGRSASRWLQMIEDAEKCFATYQDKCDKIDKLYADLERQSRETADREFQIFWANLEVLKPSLYSRPPVPVVVPRFQNRTELKRRGAEVLERSLVSSYETDDVDATMLQVRDDLAVSARGVVWNRYEADDGDQQQRFPKDHVDRKDFLHDPARKWKEVEWVARGAWVSRKKGLARFGDVFLRATFKEKGGDKDEGYRSTKKARVWELWHKTENLVVWVSPGMDEVLDIRPPFLQLEGFFPCPRPAYGTLQRRSLIPVPDFVFYKDQVEEVNELTARISSLSESLRVKGFYPGGAGDIGEAIEAVLKDQSNTATLVPVAGLAAFGDKSLKDSIVWLPVTEVAAVIKELILLRRQLIDDIYQLTGISDIMRGTTDPRETKGAQDLKSAYGSVRIKDRQAELVRIARDMTRIEAEIIAENATPETLMLMSQVEDLPTEAMVQQQVDAAMATIQQATGSPQFQQMAQVEPDKVQAMAQQAEAYLEKLKATITIEKVVSLLREQRVRPFALEIETDSTIQPDEDAAKARASEMVTAVGGYMSATLPLVQQVPQAAPMAAEFLKYIASQFRAGRELQGVIEEFADQMKQAASQPKPPPPEQVKAEAEVKNNQDKLALETRKAEREGDQKDRELDIREQEVRNKKQTDLLGMKLTEVEGEDGEPVPMDAQTQASLEAIAQLGQMIGQFVLAQGQANAQILASLQRNEAGIAGLAAMLAAPVELIRDQQGRPQGARRVLPQQAVN